MSRFTAASRSSDRSAQTPADAALWAELYFPRVEDLLRRLASVENEKRHSLHSLLFGSWPITAGVVIALICIPGCATGAILLMAAGSLDLPRGSAEGQSFGKGDRLVQVAANVRPGEPFTEISAPLAFAPEEVAFKDVALPDGIALRGTIQNATFTTSLPEPAQTVLPKPARRGAGKPISLKPPAEHPEATPKPASLLEKLFGLFAPANQASQQPAQHQT